MRASGILMPVFSLPGPFGIGTLGKEAFAFVDFLAEAKQAFWQILPIGPTGYGDSPYQSFSAFAGNPYFIDYRLLASDGWLTADEIPAERPVGPIDYGALYNERPVVLKKAADRLLASPSPAYEAFCREHSFWLEDYALFMAVKATQGQAGLADWPNALRCREPEAIAAAKAELAGSIDYYKAVQFFFYTQWSALKAYANAKGIRLVGDIPIYVSPDSSDLWTHPELFQTDGTMHLTQVAGCPPDAFAADGQLWGNPLYDWPVHKATGFAWWKQRMKYATSIYDVVRIDHFRAFDTYWKIPADCPTAIDGEWIEAPGYEVIDTLQKEIPGLDLVAEDLGLLRPEVLMLKDHYHLKGMKILIFSIETGGKYARDTFHDVENMIFYTGTHDNDTIMQWYGNMSAAARRKIRRMLKKAGASQGSVKDRFLQYTMQNQAEYAIIPLADILGLGKEGHINTPGTIGSPNWEWHLPDFIQAKKELQKFGRLIVDTKR